MDDFEREELVAPAWIAELEAESSAAARANGKGITTTALPALESRVPPHDLEAEAATLAAVMVDESAFAKVSGFLKAQHFYSDAHSRIYEAADALTVLGKPVDPVMVGAWLRDQGRLAEVGGMAYVTEVLNAAPKVANVVAYARTVHEKWIDRQVILLSQRATSKGYAGEDTGPAIAELLALKSAQEDPKPAIALPSLADMLGPALDRAQLRADGKEKAIPLPWSSVAAHFGGGLWPGVHFITAGTGVGKSALALQVALHAARADVPTAYVGLELDELQLALRLLGEHAGVPWSTLYLGKAGPDYIARARQAVPALSALPLFPFAQRPQGWSASTFAAMAEGMRARFPEAEGPGSRPLLFILDFLQIIGDEADPHGRPMNLDTRERIGRAAYAMRDISIRFNAAVLGISSVARDKYSGLFDACSAAKLDCDEDEAGRPIKRRVLNPDAVVGLGKESGEIEYSADSVSVLAKVPGTWKDGASDMLFVTAKGRATGGTWSPLHFTRWGYREADDGGSFVWEAMKGAQGGERKARLVAKASEESQREAAEDAAVVQAVGEKPGIPLRELVKRVQAIAHCGDGRAEVAIARAVPSLDVRPGPRNARLHYLLETGGRTDA